MDMQVGHVSICNAKNTEITGSAGGKVSSGFTALPMKFHKKSTCQSLFSYKRLSSPDSVIPEVKTRRR